MVLSRRHIWHCVPDHLLAFDRITQESWKLRGGEITAGFSNGDRTASAAKRPFGSTGAMPPRDGGEK